ncbi:MAG: 4-alpha-glucanotransferase [Bacteroides sp.]|nr:4-alpha-glucanotransferase [Prevotella sp.]MCM1408007.1 4-alpha-glucanotransferase [Treponema brennaborense]MCM1468983.1 4-alpha-glucanotransferase [Bacteroides sp.]
MKEIQKKSMSARKSGILLHPISLPGSPGIGTIGAAAYRFVDWLEKSRQSLWQILPAGPTGFANSPYSALSSFAGNPLLIDTEMLAESGFLTAEQAVPPDSLRSSGCIDYTAVCNWKIPLLKTAARQFLAQIQSGNKTAGEAFSAFKKKNDGWLNDFAVFMSIRDVYDEKARREHAPNSSWGNYWPKELALHDDSAVEKWCLSHSEEIEVRKAVQFFFFDQWAKLRSYANGKGISIIGDMPIFAAADSADVWAHRKFFQLDSRGRPRAVAGVPPDYFSATGQLWGNPLYDWRAIKEDKFSWWLSRIKAVLELTDFVRIDHFRGFESYWSVPAGEKTAENGAWKKGPGRALFRAIRAEFGDIPIIAEDLGVITDKVAALRDEFELPGMKVLQFAFDASGDAAGAHTNAFLPHEFGRRCVVYTGTHDNDTTAGWLSSLPPEQKELVREYICGGAFSPAGTISDEQMCPALIRLAFSSVAEFAIIPLQDIYGIGSSARMNTPSTVSGNWQWRMDADMLPGCSAAACCAAAEQKAAWLRRMSCLYNRNTHIAAF